MADITAQLIWYRLKENYESLAQSYQQFSWRRVDILDMLFLGWLLGAFLVVGFINLYLRFFGLPKIFHRQRPLYGGGRSLDGPGSLANSGGIVGGETVQWITLVLGWLCQNYNQRPAFIETWLKTLSEETKKYTERDIQIRFDDIQCASNPPQFANVSAVVKDRHTLAVLSNLTCTDVTLHVSMVTKTATHVQTTGCQVQITKLCGPLQIQFHPNDSRGGHIQLSFLSAPEIVLRVSPNSYNSDTNQSLIESIVRETIGKVALRLSVSDAGSLEPVSRSLLTSQQQSTGIAMLPSEDQTSQNFKLLVKLIKANGLMDKDFTSCDPYCTVSADDPSQLHSTSVVKNTINPFFDEYFLFDVNNYTRQIKFEVYDRSKQKGDDLLGQASVAMDDLRHLPSSRQIIPLTGRPKTSTTTSGSVTVEFLFMGNNEASTGKMSTLEPSPPRRRIEMSRALMPGGMTVTTKTTMTEKLRDQKEDPLKYNESPTRVEKAETVSNYASDSSPYTSGRSSHAGIPSSNASTSQDQILTNGLDSVTETALRQLSRQPSVPSQSATIVITGVQKEQTVPIIKEPPTSSVKTAKSPSTKQGKDGTSPGGGDYPVEAKKKSFASTLKKKFSRSKKSRSQSADRAQSFRDEGLLRPPEQGNITMSDQSEISEGGTLRKSRSHSFSSSFRNLFRRKKKNHMSRESSMSRISGRGAETSREDSIAQPSPQLSQPKGSTARQNTPVPEFSPTTGRPYSTSVPARPSPLFDH